ncbi:MAG TPA: M23 family metallopeptidase [Candidatus Kapabacteria bacterium]|nr:M23 family metallopeptidase [Candidatus Kapabacteria bacterium]
MKPASKPVMAGIATLIVVAFVLLVVSPKLTERSGPVAGSPVNIEERDSDIAVTPSLPDTSTALRDTLPPTPKEIGTLRRGSGLIIPVAGVTPDQLVDTYTAARSQGRSHNAIDIMAAKRTPVLAAADGPVKRLFTSDKGGITLYQLSMDASTVYYYAHLDAYAAGIAEGKMLKQGEVLGYVGDTGNSGAGNYHLHFAVWKITDPKNFWTGDDQNPYLLLRQ